MPFRPPWRTVIEASDFLFGLGLKGSSADGGFQVVGRYAPLLDANLMPVQVGDLVEPLSPAPGDRLPFRQAMQEHPRYAGRRLPSVGGLATPFGAQPWRVLSKGALYWATCCTLRHVHFILDDLVMDSVVHKRASARMLGGRFLDRPQGKPDADYSTLQKRRAITGAELRWVYRHRLVPAVSWQVQFWYDAQPSAPPWERADFGWDALWMNYVPTFTPQG